VGLDVAPETLDLTVPTFILQPVIENAVRYGLGSEEERCQVRVTAQIADRALLIEIHDSGPGLGGDAHEPIREGIGISNTKARLHQVYGHRARFGLRNASPTGCVVSIHIPVNEASTPKSEVDPR
jgi:LytS/YehU family sensor histidine kinase